MYEVLAGRRPRPVPFHILPLNEADVDRAFRFLEDYWEIRVRDAIRAATMLHHGVEKILSTDTHFDTIEGIVRVDPLALSQPDVDSGWILLLELDCGEGRSRDEPSEPTSNTVMADTGLREAVSLSTPSSMLS